MHPENQTPLRIAANPEIPTTIKTTGLEFWANITQKQLNQCMNKWAEAQINKHEEATLEITDERGRELTDESMNDGGQS